MIPGDEVEDKSMIAKKSKKMSSSVNASPMPVAEPNSLAQNLSHTSTFSALTATEGSCSNENTICTTSYVGKRMRKLPSSLKNFDMSLNSKRKSH